MWFPVLSAFVVLLLASPVLVSAAEDLSGTWRVTKGRGAGDLEWRITHDVEAGAVTIAVPVGHLPGRHVEYVGTVRGDTVTATHRGPIRTS